MFSTHQHDSKAMIPTAGYEAAFPGRVVPVHRPRPGTTPTVRGGYAVTAHTSVSGGYRRLRATHIPTASGRSHERDNRIAARTSRRGAEREPPPAHPTPRAGYRSRLTRGVLCLGYVLALAVPSAFAQTGTVMEAQKISNTAGNFDGPLRALDQFGASIAYLNDHNGDLAVGATHDDDGGTGLFAERGAVWILFLNADGTVDTYQKISDTSGGFQGGLADGDRFGAATASLGDLDGDSIGDLVVGAPHPGSQTHTGAVWVLFLEPDGTVNGYRKITNNVGGFPNVLDPGDEFGASAALLDGPDPNGNVKLVVGAPGDNDGGNDRGAVWILSLDPAGFLTEPPQKISGLEGGFTGALNNKDGFGSSVASLGDLDGDGFNDLAVGAPGDDDTGTDTGAVWILFLNPNGTVRAHQKLTGTLGVGTDLTPGGKFGTSLTALGDIDPDGDIIDGDGDNVVDLAVGAPYDDDGAIDPDTGDLGAVWMIYLNQNGTVKAYQKISQTQGAFPDVLDRDDWFGHAIAGIGDLDGDGLQDLSVGAPGDDDGALGTLGTNSGAVWTLFLDGCTPAAIDDGNECTVDICDGAYEWHNEPLTGTACDNGDPCTPAICNAGVCTIDQEHPLDCSSSDEPCRIASCDPNGPDGNCDILTDRLDGYVCDDTNPCDYFTCLAGTCSDHIVVGCPSDNPCQTAACDPNGDLNNCDIVTDLPDGTVCDAVDACNYATCSTGICSELSIVDCSGFGEPCREASCDPNGVYGNCDVLTDLPDFTPCDDGELCTGPDVCFAGVCEGPCNPEPLYCDLNEDGIVESEDLLCALAEANGDTPPAGCTRSADVWPCPADGGPDGLVESGDVTACLAAAKGNPPCMTCTCP